MTTTRPYFNAAGNDLIALILAGDKRAIAEASHRKSRKVQAAVRTIKAQAAAAPKAPKATTKANPLKAAAASYASSQAPRGSAAWWAAYKTFTAAAKVA